MRDNTPATFYLLLTITAVYILQLATLSVFGADAHNELFVLELSELGDVWSWITSLFAHSPTSPYHILANGIVLFFFGRYAERLLGVKRYVVFFLVAGVLASLTQVLIYQLTGDVGGLLGASGAVSAMVGLLTAFIPDKTVYLYALVPLPLWLLSLFFGLFSAVSLVVGFGGVAHGAHLAGLLLGVGYGLYLQQQPTETARPLVE